MHSREGNGGKKEKKKNKTHTIPKSTVAINPFRPVKNRYKFCPEFVQWGKLGRLLRTATKKKKNNNKSALGNDEGGVAGFGREEVGSLGAG